MTGDKITDLHFTIPVEDASMSILFMASSLGTFTDERVEKGEFFSIGTQIMLQTTLVEGTVIRQLIDYRELLAQWANWAIGRQRVIDQAAIVQENTEAYRRQITYADETAREQSSYADQRDQGPDA